MILRHTTLIAAAAAFLCACFLSLQPSAVSAQSSAGDELSRDTIAELSDEQVRRLLLEKLSATATEKASPGHADDYHPAVIAYRLQRAFGRAKERAARIFSTAGQYPAIPGRAWKSLTDNREYGSFSRFLLNFALAIVVAGAVEWFVRRRFSRIEAEISSRELETLSARTAASLTVFAGRVLRAVIFVAVAAAAYFILAEDETRDRTVFVFYMSAVAVIRFVSALSFSYFAPGQPARRIPLFDDRQARAVHLTILGTVIFGAFGFFTCALFGTLGIVGDVHTLLLISVGAATTVLLAASIFVNRKALTADLRGSAREDKFVRPVCAAIYPGFLSVFVLVLWCALLMATFLDYNARFGAALFTVALGLFVPSFDAALERHARAASLKDLVVSSAITRVSRLALICIAVGILAVAWRVNFFAMARAGWGEALAQAMLQIVITLFVAYAAWQAVRIWIDRKIAEEDALHAEETGEVGEMEIGGTGLSRIRTLLPLIKRVVQITLGTMSLMIILSSLGVNIGPLLAGAGVVGLAIGFGSQALVRDIVSGIFFLIDDAFRLGEYVDLGEVKGSVEKISIRSMRLRHHRGAVHTVPFGEIKTLTNHSRDWAIMKLKFRVPFDTDVDRVRKILKKVGLELAEHPDIKDDFIMPFKSQGAVEVDDYGFVISTKFMSKPGRQFLIRRYAFAAVQDAFQEHGIEFARPRLDVNVEDDDDEDDESSTESRKREAAAGGGASIAVAASQEPAA